jgi:spore protease
VSESHQYQEAEAVHQVIRQVLKPFAGNLMVTPKEIDALIVNTAKIIAEGISMALNPMHN